jgi:myo-inositol-1(or 4)-monophosphatase
VRETEEFLSTAIRAARLSGKIILTNLGKISPKDVLHKQASDFVTRVDREAEEAAIETIRKRFPHHLFLAEESLKETETDQYRWIIDPLDGTTNFIHQYPVFSVSVALEYKGQIILGVILDPLKNELFVAQKGKGAFLNERRAGISGIKKMKDSLITTGFPFRQKGMIDVYLRLFKEVFERVSDLRRAGSAALDLAYLACGRCEGFFEIGLSPWDVAAGSILIKEAGGVITDFGGKQNYLLTGNIVAGVPEVQEELLKEVRLVFKGIIDE